MSLLLRLILPIALATLVLDRLSKWLVVEAMELRTLGEIPVFPPFLTFRMAWNEGVNFGLLKGIGPWLLIGVSIAISVGLTWWVLRRGSAALAVGAGLVVGGALGNAWDRLQHGAVADFLNMSCCGIYNPFSFNIADIAIFAGAIWIAIRA